ncbi:PREDICTED: golgin-45-like [Priapulus caudatus]|uniref:Golgin-45-like n=1 Tax=Priapulus caudatus TaxID=37621 RepID=A0ABM1ECN3_PRICU|nr:PREDICTED: golgin-45-like [Priapulus caudatus]
MSSSMLKPKSHRSRSSNTKPMKYVPWEPCKGAVGRLPVNGLCKVNRSSSRTKHSDSRVDDMKQKLFEMKDISPYSCIHIDRRLLEGGSVDGVLPTDNYTMESRSTDVTDSVQQCWPVSQQNGPLKDVLPISGSDRSYEKIMSSTSIHTVMPGSTAVDIYSSHGFTLGGEELELKHRHHLSDMEKKVLFDEKDALATQLHIQIQVNAELKKLLVASLGEDLNERVDCLIQSNARLATEVSSHSHRIRGLYEQLEKLSIQGDVWRSKFQASRLMLNDISYLKGVLCQKYQHSQDVLRELLTEHQEMRLHLIQTYKYLKEVEEAFNPSITSYGQQEPLVPINTMQLITANQKLSDSIKFKLLGNAQLSCRLPANGTDCEAAATPGENRAMQVLANQMQLSPYHVGSLAGSLGGYHPGNPCHEVTAFDRCAHCRGEIYIV